MNTTDRQAYHRHISDTYDARSTNHEKSEWHRKTALQLVEEMPPRTGDSVLDIGTGTGTIAFHAASLLGPHGKVIGVNLSPGMLAEANKKLAASDQGWSLREACSWCGRDGVIMDKRLSC